MNTYAIVLAEVLLMMFTAAGTAGITPDAVVALDSSGQFTSINAAISSAVDRSAFPFVIHVKAGVYAEYVEVPREKWNIVIIGDGADTTVITGSRSNGDDGFTTFTSATFSVSGNNFIGRDISIINTAGPEKQQAVAFFSDADHTILYRCSVRGFQDTLYAHSGRHFYKRCYVEGTVDFVFGKALAVFQDCQLVARKGLPGQKNTITAQGRESSSEASAFVLQFCNITVTSEVLDLGIQTYLGRPWKLYSTVVVMESSIGGGISPPGWLEWSGTFALDTLFYGEFMNSGPGADLHGRVGWPGYHVIVDPAVAFEFSVTSLIQGDSWLPSVGIEYVPGLGRPALSWTTSLYELITFVWSLVGFVVFYISI